MEKEGDQINAISQDQQGNLVTENVLKKKQKSKKQQIPFVRIVLLILFILFVILVIIFLQIGYILTPESPQQTQKPAQKKEESKSLLSDLEQAPYPEKTEKLIQKQLTSAQQQLLKSRIRNQLTKRRIYADKFIENLSKISSEEKQKFVVSSDISINQFIRAIRLANATGRKQRANSPENIYEEERIFLEQKYKIGHEKELPFCIIVPTYQNMRNFKYYFNLHSIVHQNYSNFRAIFVDDGSTDGTSQAIQYELTQANKKERFVLQKNKKRVGHMANIYNSVHSFCKEGQILMIVDGDDEIIGRYVLQLFNAFYHQTKSLSIYSNHLRSIKNAQFSIGTSQPYLKEVKENNRYRFVHHNYSHLKTTWVDLFLEIKKEHLQDESGDWFSNAVDNAFYFCVMEMSCGQVEYLPELTYKYNMFTGNNVFEKAKQKSRIQNAAKIKKIKPYQCIRKRNPDKYRRVKSYLSQE